MDLVIVESPTKARKLKDYLSNKYVIEASVGHVSDLPKKTLGIDLENNYQPVYEVSDGKKKVVATLKRLAKTADKIYLATDPDREGEAIAWHIQNLLTNSKNKEQFFRSTFHEITKEAVNAAIAKPGKLDLNLVDAQQARRILDRLVGYQVSPVLWKKIRRGLSAGRVQSVALRLIVEREKEILAFKPDEFWELSVALAKEVLLKEQKVFDEEGKAKEQLDKNIFVAALDKSNGKKANVTTASQAEAISKDLIDATYSVFGVEKTQRNRQSLPPFTTSLLQQAAATSFGYSAKQTMSLAQRLYEEGLITYHRTDSFNLATSAVDKAREYIVNSFGKDYLPAKARVFSKTSKNAQEAHEAIRVTDLSIDKNNVISKAASLTEQHVKLYDLIWRRFLSSQMTPAIYDQTTILVEATAKENKNKYLLRSSGSIVRFDGWRRLFTISEDQILPDLKTNDPLSYLDLASLQKFTQAPPRYNDASLVKELEKRGIGRPSTYASIISVIVDRAYVERTQKKFFATPIGITVCDFLVEHFDNFMDYDFTASMEEDLDLIALGEKNWVKIIDLFYKPLAKKIAEVTEEAVRVQVPVEKTGEQCPECKEGEIVIRSGRFGKFKSCSRFPECKYTQNIVETLPDQHCPLCGEGDVIVKNTRWGKPFYGCSLYPKCDFASWKKPEPDYKLTKEEWAEMKRKREEWKERMGKNKKPAETKPVKKVKAKAKVKTKVKKKPATKKKSA
ncbi:type I DNA topoisomerase [Patescibacteria group bacterium]|nr:type I DNA topoisomerase [Patescibacteria group bacterium]